MMQLPLGRWPNVAVFITFSALVTAWWVTSALIWPHPWYASKKDPEVVYYANSLLIAEGARAQHTHHPGTLVQLTGVPLIMISGVTYENAFDGEKITAFTRTWQVIVLLALLAIGYAIFIRYRHHPNASILALILLLFGFNVSFFSSVLTFKPESFYFVVGLPACLTILHYFDKKSVSGYRKVSFRNLAYLCAGMILGALGTIKYNFLPVILFSLLIAPFLERISLRRSILQLMIGFGSSFLAFFALSALFSDDVQRQYAWVLLLLLGSGKYGLGESQGGFLSPSELFSQIVKQDAPQFGLTYIVFIVAIGLGLSLIYQRFTHVNLSGKSPEDSHQSTHVIALLAGLFMVFAMYCMHPYALHYILAGSVILILFSIFFFRNYEGNQKVINVLIGLLLFSTSIAAFNGLSHHYNEYEQSRAIASHIDRYVLSNPTGQYILDDTLPHPITGQVIAAFYASPLRKPFRKKYPKVGIEIAGQNVGFDHYGPGAIVFTKRDKSHDSNLVLVEQLEPGGLRIYSRKEDRQGIKEPQAR